MNYLMRTRSRATRESIRTFAHTNLVVSPGMTIRAGKLHREYLAWYDAQPVRLMSRTTFGIDYDLPEWERATATLFGTVMGSLAEKKRDRHGQFYVDVALTRVAECSTIQRHTADEVGPS